MKTTSKIVFLILAFVVPIGIFVFLKLFGRNEFDVPPLYATEAPPVLDGCNRNVSLPYAVPDSVQSLFGLGADSLTVIFFGPYSGEALNQLDRVREQTASDPVQIIRLEGVAVQTAAGDQPADTISSGEPGIAGNEESAAGSRVDGNRADHTFLRRCIFFLEGELNVVMLDRRGVIRGQYIANDRDDIDRLLTEITILLKKY